MKLGGWRLLAVLSALLAALSFTVAAQVVVAPSATAYPCNHSTDTFTGSATRMIHFLHCRHIPFTEVTSTPPPTSPKVPFTAPAGGGPPCYWFSNNSWKICYPGTHPMFLCMRWFAGSYYSKNCGPPKYYQPGNATALVGYEKKTIGGAAVACGWTAVGSAFTAVIITALTGGTGAPVVIGFIAGTAGGCIGGAAKYEWGS